MYLCLTDSKQHFTEGIPASPLHLLSWLLIKPSSRGGSGEKGAVNEHIAQSKKKIKVKKD